MWASARVPPADVPNLRARLAQIFGMAAAWGFVAEARLACCCKGGDKQVLVCSRLLHICLLSSASTLVSDEGPCLEAQQSLLPERTL